MSYIEKTAFEVRVSNNEWDNLVNITGKFQVDGADADCSAGLLCVRGENLPCEGFASAGVVNENAYYMTAATSAATIDDVVYACNTYESPVVSNGRNVWYVGHATLGLGIPAGELGTFTEVIFDKKHFYRFGIGDTDSETVAEYYTIDNGTLKTAASAPTGAGSIYFTVVGTGNFVEGVSESFPYVDVRADRVSFA